MAIPCRVGRRDKEPPRRLETLSRLVLGRALAEKEGEVRVGRGGARARLAKHGGRGVRHGARERLRGRPPGTTIHSFLERESRQPQSREPASFKQRWNFRVLKGGNFDADVSRRVDRHKLLSVGCGAASGATGSATAQRRAGSDDRSRLVAAAQLSYLTHVFEKNTS